jgi:hypothetical protein
MPTLNLEFEVYCSCGAGLCLNSTEGSTSRSQYITITPCEKCQDEKYDEGYNNGYSQCEEDKNSNL